MHVYIFQSESFVWLFILQRLSSNFFIIFYVVFVASFWIKKKEKVCKHYTLTEDVKSYKRSNVFPLLVQTFMLRTLNSHSQWTFTTSLVSQHLPTGCGDVQTFTVFYNICHSRRHWVFLKLCTFKYNFQPTLFERHASLSVSQSKAANRVPTWSPPL